MDPYHADNFALKFEAKECKLSYCGQRNCMRIPKDLGKKYDHRIQTLDLSDNSIETLNGLEQFGRLQELVLDNNNLGDAVIFPYLPNLRTLSLINNKFTDLGSLLDKICQWLPGLSYLRLMKNKACPNVLSDNDKDELDYQRYRYFVVYKLPCLRSLDSRRISFSERSEASKRGAYLRARNVPVGESATALPVDLAALGKHEGTYGKFHYKYTGKY